MNARALLLCVVLASTAFGQAIQPGTQTDQPNQIAVTTSWLYANKMHYAGAWSSSTSYNAQDVVTYNGLTYVSLAVLNQNNTPSTSMLWWASVGGGGTVAGADTQIQYNASGALGASSNFTWAQTGGSSGTILTNRNPSGAAEIDIDGAAGTQRTLKFLTGGQRRWSLFLNTDAETGNNAGSTLTITRAADNGSFLDTPVQINRQNGLMTIGDGLSVTNGVTVNGGAVIQTGTLQTGLFQQGASPGAVGTTQMIATPGSPDSSRLSFGTDNSGWSLAIAKNAAGTTTDIFRFYDNGQATALQPWAANDTPAWGLSQLFGADATLGPLSLQVIGKPSATGANRWTALSSGDNLAMRPLVLNTNGTGAFGHVLVGTTADNGASDIVQINGSTRVETNLSVGGAAGTQRVIHWLTDTGTGQCSSGGSGCSRWSMFADADAETGSSAGSTLQLYRYSDSGPLDAVMTWNRATGLTTVNHGVSVTGAVTLGTPLGVASGGTGAAPSAADQTPVTTASNTGSWASLPSCLDAGGNHLNYNTSTHAFICGSSGGTVGSAAFSTITGGTNSSAAMVVGTGASLGATGSGTIAATGLGSQSYYTASTTATLGAIVDGDCASVGPFALAQASVGDMVFAGVSVALPSGVNASAKVTSSGNVAVEVCNLSESSQTIGAATYKVALLH